eukprot:TRINITY_DN1515_c0_g2_i2.p1 TRINITY_DN1515_c0_g2~~TRINITY_DN1515_c0_g2_i2.p1  ORF type:complete len:115 (+),score=11.83 TRINITY_DN1515_c0_g2_i2:409-753(+)
MERFSFKLNLKHKRQPMSNAPQSLNHKDCLEVDFNLSNSTPSGNCSTPQHQPKACLDNVNRLILPKPQRTGEHASNLCNNSNNPRHAGIIQCATKGVITMQTNQIRSHAHEQHI